MELPNFVQRWLAACPERFYSVALPEGRDPRVQSAALILADFPCIDRIDLYDGGTGPVLSSDFPESYLSPVALDKIRTHSWGVQAQDTLEHFLRSLTLRGKSPPPVVSLQQDGRWSLYLAGIALQKQQVNAVVAGCQYASSEVIRASLACVGMESGISKLSGAFILNKEESLGGAPPSLYLASDCAVQVRPSSKELVEIAKLAARARGAFEPQEQVRVAFLSFSSKGSAMHPEQEKMALAAREFAEQMASDSAVISDGELQFDAAINSEIAQRKDPKGVLRGEANCLIFPNLDAGNIGYKMAQRWGGFAAYGPILLGLAKPYNDLSRGASVHDIVVTTLLALMRAEIGPRQQVGIMSNILHSK